MPLVVRFEPSGSFAAFVPYLAEAIPAVRLVLRARRAFGVHVGEEVTCGNQDESLPQEDGGPAAVDAVRVSREHAQQDRGYGGEDRPHSVGGSICSS
jgi:hypothetical protein